jgi:hypothetical protein
MQDDYVCLQSAAPATKSATHLLKRTQKYCACHTKPQNDFRPLCRHVRISPSATLATQYDITICVETFEKERFGSFPHRHGDGRRTPFAELTIGMAIRPSHARPRTVANGCDRLRTVANGCERLQTVADVNATSSEHTLNPADPQSDTGTLATHSGKH